MGAKLPREGVRNVGEEEPTSEFWKAWSRVGERRATSYPLKYSAGLSPNCGYPEKAERYIFKLE
jgi:hypothetical protein